MSRNDIQSPFSFEFSEGFLLGSAASHKIPQRRSTQSQIGAHGGILKITVVRVKQIELIVLFRFVMHGLSVDHHSQRFFPSGNGKRELEVSHTVSERLPALAFSNQSQQAQPLKERNFDGVPRFFSLQQLDHLSLEKGSVHAEF